MYVYINKYTYTYVYTNTRVHIEKKKKKASDFVPGKQKQKKTKYLLLNKYGLWKNMPGKATITKTNYRCMKKNLLLAYTIRT